MNLALIKTNAVKQGFLSKSASAKVKDKVRDKWEERWFSLRGYTLYYFKKKEDSKPKGEIDLRAAVVDPVGLDKTGKPHCLRIQQAKQIFNYLQANDANDCKEWLLAIRASAGYPPPSEMDRQAEIKTPMNHSASFCSFGCLLVSTTDGAPPEKCVVTAEKERGIRLAMAEKIYRQYKGTQLTHITWSVDPEIRLVDTSGVFEVHSVTMDFKDESPSGAAAGATTRHKFFVGTMAEAKAISQLFDKVKTGDLSEVIRAVALPSVQSGNCQMADSTQSGVWAERFVTVLEKRIVVFRTGISTIPVWSFLLAKGASRKEGKTDIIIRTSIETITLRLENEAMRDAWYDKIDSVSISLVADKILDIAIPSPVNGSSAAIGGGGITSVEFKNPALSAPMALPPGAAPPEDETDGPVDGEFVFDWPKASSLAAAENSYVISVGQGRYGQLGNKSKENCVIPQILTTLNTQKVRSIAAGAAHAAAITEAGRCYMWGQGDEGQLGLGPNMKSSASPFIMTSMMKEHFIHITCGRAHTMAITKTGKLFTWGAGEKGQLGIGDSKSYPYPVQVKGALVDKVVKGISCGGDHSAVIAGDKHDLYTWGDNEFGQCGTGDVKSKSVPTQVTVEGKVVQVSCGSGFTAIIIRPGRCFTFGRNTNGQLGQGDTKNRLVPNLIQYFSQRNIRIKQIWCGGNHTVAIGQSATSSGTVMTWGAGITNGFREDQLIPTAVSALTNPVFVTASSSHSVTASGLLQMFSFGINNYGELGNGKARVQALVKVELSAECLCSYAAVGDGFTIALMKGEPPEFLSPGARLEKAEADRKMDIAPTRFDIDDSTLVDGMGGTLDWEQANAKLLALMSGGNPSAAGGSAKPKKAGVIATGLTSLGPNAGQGQLITGADDLGFASYEFKKTGAQMAARLAVMDAKNLPPAPADDDEVPPPPDDMPPYPADEPVAVAPVRAAAAPVTPVVTKPARPQAMQAAPTSPLLAGDFEIDLPGGGKMRIPGVAAKQPAAASPAATQSKALDPAKAAILAAAAERINTMRAAQANPSLNAAMFTPPAPLPPAAAATVPVAPAPPSLPPSVALLSSLAKPSIADTPPALPPVVAAPPATPVEPSPAVDSTAAAAGAAASGKKKDDTPLPEGWKKVKDAATGKDYYFHSKTRAVSWKRPKA